MSNDLLYRAVAAHGGLERFNQFKTVSASLVNGGALWSMKGQAGFLDAHVTVDLHQEHTSFQLPNQRVVFTPQRVALETYQGAAIAERAHPRAAFAGHILETPWGYSGPLLLLWLCHVDLFDRPLLVDMGRLRGRRDRALAGAERDLAASLGEVPIVHRLAQRQTNLLFRCRWAVAQARL